MACEHTRKVRQMEWPDGGISELCEDCLLTRHIDVITTEWQDHGYKSPADWYNEARKLQKSMDKTLENFRRENKIRVRLRSFYAPDKLGSSAASE